MNALDRRNEILRILNSRKSITVPELAKRFEVSERTILRDITYLSSSAPIVTTQGKHGGISLMSGYKYNDYRYYLGTEQASVLDKIISQCRQSGTCNLSLDDLVCIEGIKDKYVRK